MNTRRIASIAAALALAASSGAASRKLVGNAVLSLPSMSSGFFPNSGAQLGTM